MRMGRACAGSERSSEESAIVEATLADRGPARRRATRSRKARQVRGRGGEFRGVPEDLRVSSRRAARRGGLPEACNQRLRAQTTHRQKRQSRGRGDAAQHLTIDSGVAGLYRKVGTSTRTANARSFPKLNGCCFSTKSFAKLLYRSSSTRR